VGRFYQREVCSTPVLANSSEQLRMSISFKKIVLPKGAPSRKGGGKRGASASRQPPSHTGGSVASVRRHRPLAGGHRVKSGAHPCNHCQLARGMGCGQVPEVTEATTHTSPVRS